MLKDMSPSLVAAVTAISRTSAQKYFEERKALEEKMAAKQMKLPTQRDGKADKPAHSGAADMATKNMKEEVGGTVPKTAKEKSLAKLAPPADKITHGDVMKGRGVRKEAWEDMLKAAKERRAAQGTGKFDVKKISTGTVYTRKPETFDDGGKDADMKKAEKKMKKEELQQANEMSHQATTTMKHVQNATAGEKAAAKDIKPGVAGYRDRVAMLKSAEARGGLKKEERDTPGNSAHQCAIHVKSEQYGEGRTLTSQHAEPDAEGNIAWYDVMFAEGIKRVNTEDIEVLVSEGHMNHKKKKA